MISETTISVVIYKLAYIGGDLLKVIPFKWDPKRSRLIACKHYINKFLPYILLISELCSMLYAAYNYETKNAEDFVLMSLFNIAASASILIKLFIVLKKDSILTCLNAMLILNEKHRKDLFSLNYTHKLIILKKYSCIHLFTVSLNLIWIFGTLS